MSQPPLHPDEALYDGGPPPAELPGCEHYAGNEKLMRKALKLQHLPGSPRFDLTCDLDDGAPRGGELHHARMVAELLASEENRLRRAGVRIHDLRSPFWQQDVEVVLSGAGAQVAYITLPRAEKLEQVQALDSLMTQIEDRLGLQRQVPVQLIAESVQAVHGMWEMGQVPRVEAAALGIIDLVASTHGALDSQVARSPGQFEHPMARWAKSEFCAACLGAGITASHGVTLDLEDGERSGNDAREAREQFAFRRQISVHPIQIGPIVQAFTPELTDLRRASEVLVAAQDLHWAPMRQGGRFEDRATYRAHWTLLKRAHALGLPLGPEVETRFFALD